MRLTDVLMLRELIGPFVFGVALFTLLGMSITYLFAFTDMAVRGTPVLLLLQTTALLLPGMLTKTLPAAMLLASLLATGRMSGDSETTALFAVGVNLWQAIRAVGFAGLAVCLVAIACTEYVVPAASTRAAQLKIEAANYFEQNPLRPVSIPVHSGKSIEFMITAKDSDFRQRTLWGVLVVHYPKPAKDVRNTSSQPDWFAFAKRAVYSNGTFELTDGTSYSVKDGVRWDTFAQMPVKPTAGPTKLDALIKFFEGQQVNKDPDTTSLEDTLERIRNMKVLGVEGAEAIRNLEMGFFNKLAFPMATVIFALVGAPLGIRQSRTSNALGFALSLVIIFAYWMFSSYMSVLGQGGTVAPWLASFGPNIIGLVFAAGLLVKRSR